MHAAATLLLASAILLPAPSVAATDARPVLATLLSATRLVRVREKPGAEVAPAKVGMSLAEGAQVITLQDARCQIKFGDGRFMSLAANTTIDIARLPRRGALRSLIRLVKGRVRASVNRSVGEGDFGVFGMTTVTAVKGTEWDVARDEKTNKVDVIVSEGRVNVGEIKNDQALDLLDRVFLQVAIGAMGVTCPAGQMLSVFPGSPFPQSPVPIPPGFPNPFAPPTGAGGSKSGSKGMPGMPGMPGMGFP